MHILVTGGSGLIGRNFIKANINNYKFTVLSREPKKAKLLLPSGVGIIKDLPQENCFDIIINLAGEAIIDKRWSAKQKDIICNSRWLTTEFLVDMIERSSFKPRCLISGSAIGYYGETDDHLTTESNTVKQPDFAHSLCLKWELIAKQAEKHCRVILLRTGIVITDSGGALRKMLPSFRLGLGGKIGSGKQWMSWLHLDDMVNILAFCIENKLVTGAINCCSPNAVTNSEFSQQLAATLSRPCMLNMPAIFIKFIMGERAELLLVSQNIYPEKLLVYGYTFKYPELRSTLNSLLNK